MFHLQLKWGTWGAGYSGAPYIIIEEEIEMKAIHYLKEFIYRNILITGMISPDNN